MNEKFRILVLDDSEGILDLLKRKLVITGYNYDYETNPLTAIERIRSNHYDMLILDFNMAPIKGDEVIKRVKEIDKDLYIILLTGESGKTLINPSQFIKDNDIQSYCVKSTDLLQLILLIELGIKKIISDRIIKMYNEGINNLLKLVPKLYKKCASEGKNIDKNHKEIIDNILKEMMTLFVNARNSFIILNVNINGELKTIYRGIGKYKTEIDDFVKMLDSELMESWLLTKANNTAVKVKNGTMFPLNDEIGENIGVLYIENINEEDKADFDIVNMFAYQVASSLVVNMKNEELVIAHEKLNEHFLDTVEALRIAVDEKDTNTLGHSDRVSFFAVKIGEVCGCNEQEIKLLKYGGLFHDIGKLGIPDSVLKKEGRYTDEELNIMKRHTDKGERIISSIKLLESTVPLIKYHHERFNGEGYYGVKGEEIPFLARIMVVADSFDAITSKRCYKDGKNIREGVEELIKCKGEHFDPFIVDKFIEIISTKYSEWESFLDQTREYLYEKKDLFKDLI